MNENKRRLPARHLVFAVFAALLSGGCVIIPQIDYSRDGLKIDEKIVIDNAFVDELWYKTCQVVGVHPYKPKVHFKIYSPVSTVTTSPNSIQILDSFGRCLCNTKSCTVEVYIHDSLAAFDEAKDQQAFIYSVIAHEFLHSLYLAHYPKDLDHHCKMLETGHLTQLADFIQNKTGCRNTVLEFENRVVTQQCQRRG